MNPKPTILHFKVAAGAALLGMCGGAAAQVEQLRWLEAPTDANAIAWARQQTARRTGFTWLDKDRVLISHTLGASPRTSAKWGAVARVWRRGTSVETAPIVYRAKARDAMITIDQLGDPSRPLGVIQRVIDYSTFELNTIDTKGNVTRLDLPTKLKPFGVLTTTQRHLVVQLAEPAEIHGERYAAETVLSYDTDVKTAPAQRVKAIHLPREGENVDAGMGSPIAGLRAGVAFTIRRGLQKSVQLASPGADGWKARDVFTAPPGISATFDSSDPSGDDVVLRTQGYLVPAELRLLHSSFVRDKIGEEQAGFDAKRMVVESRRARSREDTIIDYFLIRRASSRRAKRRRRS